MPRSAPCPDVRRLGAGDAAAYRDLRLRALREHPEAFTSDAEAEQAKPLAWSAERLAEPHNAFWGGFDTGGAIVGMVGLERGRRPKEAHKGTVVGMYVAPACAGQGLGGALLAALLQQARHWRLSLLVLTVTAGNASAVRVYERVGFRAFGTEPRAVRVDGRYHGKIHMSLEL